MKYWECLRRSTPSSSRIHVQQFFGGNWNHMTMMLMAWNSNNIKPEAKNDGKKHIDQQWTTVIANRIWVETGNNDEHRFLLFFSYFTSLLLFFLSSFVHIDFTLLCSAFDMRSSWESSVQVSCVPLALVSPRGWRIVIVRHRNVCRATAERRRRRDGIGEQCAHY